ncbi:solute carrier family 2, facilitated glucose transporter member 5-like [Lissotriton helveticus]
MANPLLKLVKYRVLLEMIVVLGIGGSGQFGFQYSVLNSLSPLIKNFINETWVGQYHSTISYNTLTFIWSSIVSLPALAAIIGSTAAGYLSRKYGKKRSLLWGNLFLVGASMIMGFSKIAGSFQMLLIGRFIVGIYSGLALTLNWQYVGEIAPKKLREYTNTTMYLFYSSGAIPGLFLSLSGILGTESSWPILVSIGGGTALVQLVRIPFYPESPPYLLLEKGDKDACIEAMRQLWGDDDFQEEIDDLMKEQEAMKNVQTLTFLELLRDRSCRLQLYLMVLVILTDSIGGVNSIYFYSYDIFLRAGIAPQQIPRFTMWIAVCDCVATFVCGWLIKRCGMKSLLLTGYGLMVITLTLLTVALSMKEWYHWMPLCSVVLVFMFMCVHGIGPGSVTISITVANFTQASRPQALVITSVLTFGGLFVIGMIFPYMVESLGQYCFLVFVAIIAISGAIIYFYQPETTGLSTMEITEQFYEMNFQGSKEALLSGAQAEQHEPRYCSIF